MYGKIQNGMLHSVMAENYNYYALLFIFRTYPKYEQRLEYKQSVVNTCKSELQPKYNNVHLTFHVANTSKDQPIMF